MAMSPEQADLDKARAFMATKTYPFEVTDPATGEKMEFVFRDIGHSEIVDQDIDQTDKKATTYRLIAAALLSPKLTAEDLANGRWPIVNQLIDKYNTLFLQPGKNGRPSDSSPSTAPPTT